MGITLNELKARATQNIQAPTVQAPVTETPAKKESTLLTKSANALKATGRAIDGSMPVSKRMFAEMATKRLDTHERELRYLQHQMELLAHNTGQALPSREEIVAYDEQLQLEAQAAAEAERAAKEAELQQDPDNQVVPAFTDQMLGQLQDNMAQLMALVGQSKTTPLPKEKEAPVEQDAPEVDNEPENKDHLATEKETTAPKAPAKPKTGKRRKLERQAPLME